MRFEWDEAENRANLRKHGFPFADAARNVFDGLVLAHPIRDTTTRRAMVRARHDRGTLSSNRVH